jgi:hypothetical protein
VVQAKTLAVAAVVVQVPQVATQTMDQVVLV